MIIKSWTSPRQSNWYNSGHHEIKGDLRSGTEARIHDPLWFLARQWQMGEFRGEDARSPVLVTVKSESFAINCVHQGNQSLAYNPQETPLEALIERESTAQVPPDLRTCAQL